MTFDTYMKEANATSEYPNIGKNVVYPAMGISGEAGELLDKVKKHWRNFNHEMNNPELGMAGISFDHSEKEEIKKEMGDVLWYLAAMCRELSFSFDDVAKTNIKKLQDRKKRNVVCGKGDNR